MDKKKILELAQKEGAGDEFEKKVLTNSIYLGTAIALIVCGIFIMLEFFFKGTINDSLIACCSIIIGLQYLIEGVKLKKRRSILIGILFLVIALIFVALFIVRMVSK